jgi:hypothetical protein
MQVANLVGDLLRPLILEARAERVEANRITGAPTSPLPLRNVADVSYRSGRVQRLDQTVRARSFDRPSVPIAAPKATELRGDLPAWTPREDITETDLMRAQRLLGQAPNLAPSVAQSARRVVRTVLNTLEQCGAQLLSTGEITIDVVDATPVTLDFGVPAANKFTFGAAAWASSARDILADLMAMRARFVAMGGDPSAAQIVTSDKVLAAMLSNTGLRDLLGSSNAVTRAGLAAALQVYGLPPVVPYDRVLRNAAGVRVPVWPVDALAFVPVGDPIGSTQVGVTAEAIEQVTQQVLLPEEAPGVTVVTLGNDDPVQRAVKAAAVGLPVLDEPDLLVIARDLVAA